MLDSKRDTDINNRLLDSVRKGEGGMICDNIIASLFTIARTWKQPNCLPPDEWIRK